MTMIDLDCDPSNSLLPVQRHAEKLFNELMLRLSNAAKQETISWHQLETISHEIIADQTFLTNLFEIELNKPIDESSFSDERTQHFKRFALHQMLCATSESNSTLDENQKKYWLLHLIELSEIAIGQYRFQHAQSFCDAWIENAKKHGQFSYNHFLLSHEILEKYIVLVTQLAIFFSTKQEHRINWLLESMESNPTSRVEYGREIHVNQNLRPPTKNEVKELLIEIFEHLLCTIKQHQSVDALNLAFPQLASDPTLLIESLINHLRKNDSN